MIAEIKRVDLLVGKNQLNQKDYNRYAKMSSDGVKLRFGSWEKALIVAGLGHKYFGTKISDKMRQQCGRSLTDKELLDELKRVSKLLGTEIITRANFNHNSEINSGTVVNRFESWHKALLQAGLGYKYSGKIITENMRRPKAKALSNEGVLREIQRISKLLNKETVTAEDVRAHSDVMSVGVVSRRFGSWAAAMEKAGLKVSEMYHRKYSDEEYFENLLNVWTQYGRQPKYREMDSSPSKISAATYASHFGSWHKGLEAFVARMNKDEQEISQIPKEEKPINAQLEIPRRSEIVQPRPRILVENRREIRLGLRYKVLNRDKFKCIRCGASPAIEHSCHLHVDHIIPFSKNGRTTVENLQTLCEKCNLGKSNRYSD